MKKNARNVIDLFAVATAISSIALSIHISSLHRDLKESHFKLNQKYTQVTLEREGLQDANIQLTDEAKKSLELLEQSNQEVEKLAQENQKLQDQVLYDKSKIGELEKKLKSTP